MFELLDNMVEEIGEEHVVQVVTDGASNLVAAGRMLMEKRTKLFWSPCAAHCLDPVLEDIGELLVFYNTISNAKKITTYLFRSRKNERDRSLSTKVETNKQGQGDLTSLVEKMRSCSSDKKGS